MLAKIEVDNNPAVTKDSGKKTYESCKDPLYLKFL